VRSRSQLTEYSSDADAEVLADYVVALVTTKDTDINIRRNCLDSLSDFLQDSRYCALVLIARVL
jgi:hypothetical protein